MKPIISHISAVEYWKSVRIGERKYRVVSSVQTLLAEPPVKSSFEEPGPWWLEKPLHVLVSSDKKRRSSGSLVCHVRGKPLPRGSILDAGNGFYVCSPELSFVQIANSMELPQLIEFGFEMCGTYDITNESFRSCKPLTSVKKLIDFAVKAKGVNGRNKALRALRYVAENSASPKETFLVMLLCLPNMLGGYGIEKPLLNYRINMNKKAANVAKKNHCICDLYWPDAKLAVEYDSDEFHSGAEQISKDSARRAALTAKGITVISVTNNQLNNGGELNGVAHIIASQIGKRLQYEDPAFTQAHHKLRKSLRRELSRHSEKVF